jgi:hypothetical protein
VSPRGVSDGDDDRKQLPSVASRWREGSNCGGVFRGTRGGGLRVGKSR